MRTLRPILQRRERRRLVEEAWRSYVVQGADEPAGVGEEIARSWRRARNLYRIDPGITRPGGRVLAAPALAARREHDEVFRLAAPILADFARRLGLHETVLAYLDGEGVMLSIDGDRALIDEAGEIDFRPGSCWAEAVAGTNGPGTALVERGPVEVFSAEHFVAAWHPWSCAAAPVLAPAHASPVGVVNLTAPWEVQRRHALVIAKAIARTVEERLRAAIGVRNEVVRYAFRAAQEAGDALVAVDARGRAIAANEAAVRRGIIEAGALPRRTRETIAAALCAPGTLGGDVRVATPEGRIVVASPVQYDGTTVGAVLRVSAAAPRARDRGAPARRAARYDVISRAGATSPRAQLRAHDLPIRHAPVEPRAPGAARPRRALQGARGDSDCAALVEVLEACSWNIVQSARRLGVSRMTLYRRLHRYGLPTRPGANRVEPVPPAPEDERES
ncbi:helix-turn-helix domain-containing protein [Anaeromyxobacter oryzae]|uniref:DNA binding HTH domain-containing protein n=1 Tax=Anaeromyxobacter oryzae TaxID=2918170 RepID=A0ABN6N0Y3_9BACT|nr:helix-turn-helix domain-containing protein [Anaeromyxobacter oryzae]BDG05564.1 hypothetical protein AMOR_45600 [Anaeromyxobacter oryzae]